ncbi:MAG: adenylate/guanylate cyclase domain-containing protein [Desulfobacter sp.]|nr:MAG: adenylate/guanylate cyclase domain-containing protein [Desulfobacter sp.]
MTIPFKETLARIFNLPFWAGCLVILLSCAALYVSGNEKPLFVAGMDNKVTDIMFRIRGPRPHTGQVVIVDIDEKSLGRFGQWPWPRDLMAGLTRAIHGNGGRVIGFDIVFAEPDRTSPRRQLPVLESLMGEEVPPAVRARILARYAGDNDAAFGEALADTRAVLGYAFQFKNDGLKAEDQTPFPSARIRLVPESVPFRSLALIPAYRALINTDAVAMAESEGFFNVITDESGTVRQVPLLMAMDGVPYPSLALETFRVGRGLEEIIIHTDTRLATRRTPVIGISMGDSFFPTSNTGRLFVNHRGPPGTFPYLSAADLLTGKKPIDLAGKYVLVGSSATGLFDLRATPFSSTMPGIEINANIIDNLIQKDPFAYDRYTEIGITYLLVISGGFVLTLILCRLSPVAGSLGAFGFLGAVFWGNYYFFFLNNRQVGLTHAAATYVLILVLVSVLNYVREGRAKRYIQKAFSHYLAPDVVSSLIKQPGKLTLSGEQKELTVLFSDIRDFTSISEKMDSSTLGRFMNRYLTRMSRIIMDNGGTVDKFIGDAIMAFWGAPKDEPDHAGKAVETALAMIKSLEDLNLEFASLGLPRVRIGVGINTGIVSVGNFGSQDRFDYTVMGDNVNLASRLEGTNKTYGTVILVSQATKAAVDGRFEFGYVDEVRVKGKEIPVKIYTPMVGGKGADQLPG